MKVGLSQSTGTFYYDTMQGFILTDISGDTNLVTTRNTSVRCLTVHERKALQVFTIS